MSQTPSDTRKALHELMDLLREVDERFLGSEWGIEDPASLAEASRAVMHILQAGSVLHFEESADHPVFRRIVTPYRKLTGDNPDAIYYEAPIRGGLVYRIRGDMAGAVYVSITVEAGAENAGFAARTAGVINDTQFDVDADGRFEISLGGPEQARNWLPLPEDSSYLTTRHYFEEAASVAADTTRSVPLQIEALDAPSAAPPPPDDTGVAAGIRRVSNFVRSRTLDMPRMGQDILPDFVSTTPNAFPAPVKPGDFALSAFDAAYSMAPYVFGPDDALVVTGRWPECRCANVCLWTRHQMTYDYANRSAGLNRAQTQLEEDGSFRMVLAHRDPGVANWIDTEGRPFGMVFWRYMLPEGPIETPRAEVVPFTSLAG
ncbi:MAG: DUF1214 domain-containing protein [Deltaproteobacteria bacterium]|nr:DUF1214 domain-containing protein [Deltaproteobacteria bacterium]